MRNQQRLRAGLALAAIAAALAGAGCGSSSNTDTAHIRAVDVGVNAGNAAVIVNGGAIGGKLTFGQVVAYNFIGQGTSTFGFTTDAPLKANITQPASPTLTLNIGSYYTGYLIGRSDVAGKADPRFLQTVIAGDKGAAAGYSSPAMYVIPPSGQANIRILNAAPDAGAVDVLVNGNTAFPAVAYPAFPAPSAGSATAPAVNPVTAYQPLPISSLTIQVNAAGTAKVLVPAKTIAVSGGNAYTVVVTEPTLTPAPIFGLQTVSDQP